MLIGADAAEVDGRDAPCSRRSAVAEDATELVRGAPPPLDRGHARRRPGRWSRRFAEAGVERLMLQDFLPRDLDMIDLMGAELIGRV